MGARKKVLVPLRRRLRPNLSPTERRGSPAFEEQWRKKPAPPLLLAVG